MSDERFQQALPGAWAGIAGNMALAVMMAALGFLSGSKALIADAFRTGSAAVWLGLRSTKLPADQTYSYGHGKAKSASAVFVPVLVLVVGLEIAISSAKAIYYGADASPKPLALLAIAISIVVKEAMFQYEARSGRSESIIVEGRNRRADFYCSLAAFAGVGGAQLGNYTGNTYLYYLDPIAGLFLASIVMKTGYRLATESIHSKLDQVLHEEHSAELIAAVQEIKGIIAIDHFTARERGHYVIVDMKISVNPEMTVHEGHDIANKAKRELMKRFMHVAGVNVHVNPYDPGYSYKHNADSDHDDFSLLH